MLPAQVSSAVLSPSPTPPQCLATSAATTSAQRELACDRVSYYASIAAFFSLFFAPANLRRLSGHLLTHLTHTAGMPARFTSMPPVRSLTSMPRSRLATSSSSGYVVVSGATCFASSPEACPHVVRCLLSQRRSPLLGKQEWLAKAIHSRGSLDPSGDELMQAVTGSRLQPSILLNHLRTKYAALYKL